MENAGCAIYRRLGVHYFDLVPINKKPPPKKAGVQGGGTKRNPQRRTLNWNNVYGAIYRKLGIHLRGAGRATSSAPLDDLNININSPLQTHWPSAKTLFVLLTPRTAMPKENFKSAACP